LVTNPGDWQELSDIPHFFNKCQSVRHLSVTRIGKKIPAAKDRMLLVPENR
jgi:hypothetical protein